MAETVTMRDGRIVRTVSPGELLAELSLGSARPRRRSRSGGRRLSRGGRLFGALGTVVVLALFAVSAIGANVGGFEIDANQALEGSAASQEKAYYPGNDVPPGDDWVGDSLMAGDDGIFYLDTDGGADFPDCYDSDISLDPGLNGAATLICDGTSNSTFDDVENEENIVSPSGQTPDDEWPISGGNNTPKNDITHGYLLFRQGDSVCDADSDPDDLFAYIGAERLNHEGSAFWGVELNKIAPDGFDDLKNNTPLDFTLDHNRTAGDMLISINLTNGGEEAEITPFTLTSTPADGADANWTVAVSNCDPDGPNGNPPLIGDTQGATNTDGDVLAPPWNVLVCDPSETNKANSCRLVNEAGTGTEAGDRNVPERDFFEVVVDFTEFGIPSQCFGTAILTSRSSFPLNSADLKDVAGGEVGLCDLAVDKTGDTLSKIGDSVDYTITVSNPGVVPLFKEDITDTLLGDITLNGVDQANPLITSNTCGVSLAPDASCTITATRTVLATDPDPLPNTVTVVYDSSVGLLGAELSRSDDHSVNLFQPSVTIDKTGDTLSKVGDSVDYDITVTNTSSTDSPNLTCDVTDDLLGVIANDVSLAPGASQVFDADRVVEATDDDPLVNTASVDCTVDGFGNVVDDEDDHSVNLFQPSFTVACETDVSEATTGDTITYSFLVTNTSSADSPDLNLVSATDTLLGDLATNFATAGVDVLSPGESATVTATHLVLSTDADPLVNTLTVTYQVDGFPNQLMEEAGCEVDLIQGCALSPGFWGGGEGVSKWDQAGDPVAAAAGFTTSTVFPWLDSSLAGKTYLQVLQLPAVGDVTRQLAFKYIAAKLNQAAFGVDAATADLLLEIEDYFDSDGVDNGDANATDLWSQPVGSKPTGAAKTEGQRLFGLINTYFATVGEEGCPDPGDIPEL